MPNLKRRRMAYERGYSAGLAAGRSAHTLTVIYDDDAIVCRMPVNAFALSPLLHLPSDIKIFILDEQDPRVRRELPPLQ